MTNNIQLIKQQLYPQQAVKISAVPKAFNDSTHHLYLAQTLNHKAFIKLFSSETFQPEAFWHGMKLLFNFDLEEQFHHFDHLYHSLKQTTDLPITSIIATKEMPKHFLIAADFLEGNVANATNEETVKQLARHLAQIHQSKSSGFGYLHHPQPQSWPQHLQNKLPELLHGLATDEIERLNNQINQQFDCDSFCPIMPDLRWDQFLIIENDQLVLTDLDAFVLGPVALEWVLLEYLLPATLAKCFLETYQQYLKAPKLREVREVYRAILFSMNVLGETDYQKWQQQPTLFD